MGMEQSYRYRLCWKNLRAHPLPGLIFPSFLTRFLRNPCLRKDRVLSQRWPGEKVSQAVNWKLVYNVRELILRMDHYFCDWGRELSNFQNKIMHTNCHGKKKSSKCFLLSGSSLTCWKKFLHKLLPIKKNHAQPEGEKKKIHGPEIAHYPPPSPQLKKIIGHP